MELISSTGIYDDIPIDRYHGEEICVSPSISVSGIKAILDCPLRFWHSSALNPDRDPPKSDALRFGAAVHMSLTHPVEFAQKVRTWGRFDAKTEMERAAHTAAGGIALREKEYADLTGMLDAIRVDPLTSRYYGQPGYVEQTLVYKDPATGIFIRSRPDFRPDSMKYAIDYKTAASASHAAFTRSCFNFGYHIQAAVLRDSAHFCLGQAPDHVLFTAQEKSPPYIVGTYFMSDEGINIGRMMVAKALRIYAECLSKGVFPGYTPEPTKMLVPSWIEWSLKDDDQIDTADMAPPK